MRTVRRIVSVTAISLMALAAPAMAQDNTPKTLLAFEFAGCDQASQNPKDAALLRAVSMIPARIKELKASAQAPPDFRQIPDEVIDLAWARFGGPVRLAVTAREGRDPNTGWPLIAGVLSFGTSGEQEATALHHQVTGLVHRMHQGQAQNITPSPRYTTMSQIQLPPGAVTFGPRNGPDGWRYEVHFGPLASPDKPFDALPEVAGGSTMFSASVDLAAISPYIQPFVSMAMMGNPQGTEAMTKLREAGIFGPEALTIHVVAGQLQDRKVSDIILRDAADNAAALNLSTTPVSDADLAVIPEDAFFAAFVRSDLKGSIDKLLAQAGPVRPQVDQFLAQFREQTGVDLMTDVVATLGQTGAVYMADSTGGNSLMSLTMVQRLADAAKLKDSIGKLSGFANGMVRQQIPTDMVGVALRQFDQEGATFTQLRVAGLPVPFQPTFAIREGWMATSVTPQGCITAIRHCAKPGKGLAGNARFAAEFARVSKAGKPVAVTFLDPVRTMADGYGLVQLGCTALESAVCSPSGMRDPGMVLPPLNQLREGTAPTLRVSYWVGNDYVVHSSGDTSILANLAGIVGFADLGQTIASTIAGAGIGTGMSQGMGFQRRQMEYPPPGQETWPAQPAEQDPAF